MFGEAGLPYTQEIDHVPNSRRALQLGELARDRGRHHELHPRLMDAYWHRGVDIGDPELLRAEATAAGLEAAEVDEVLAGEAYLDRIAADTQALHEAGGGGVPAWIIDDRVLLQGAQPHEVFERVMERLESG